MKVGLFCGGYGMRMRDGVSDLPKPMHQVGPRPLIWHVMRYYAHFGHKDFILCLATHFEWSASGSDSRLAGVSITLGRIALQRMPSSRYSASSAWTKASTAALAAM